MIDVTKELEHYNPKDKAMDMIDDELIAMLNIFNKTTDKIAKMQYQSLNSLDTLVEILDEINETDDKVNLLNKESKGLLDGLIEILDLMEDIYIYSIAGNNEGLKKQIQLQWDLMDQTLLSHQITRFGNIGDIFDLRLHIAKKVKEYNESNESNEPNEVKILEVIKSGYTYKGNLIRKAQVVINK